MTTPTFAAALTKGSRETLFEVTPSGRVVAWERLAELALGHPRGEAVGRLLVALAVPPEGVDEVRHAMRLAMETGRATCTSVSRTRDGRSLGPVPMTIRRVGEGTSATLVFSVGQDATPARPPTAVATHVVGQAAPAEPGPPPDALTGALSTLQAALQADTVVLALLGEDGSTRVGGAVGLGAEAARPPGPVTPQVLGAREPMGVEPTPSSGLRTVLAVPVVRDGRPLAVLYAATRALRDFSDDERRALRLGADMLAWSLSAPAPFLPVEADLAALRAQAGMALEGSFEPTVMMRRLAEVLVPRFADWCAMDLLEPTGLVRRVTLFGRDGVVDSANPLWDVPRSGDAPLTPVRALRAGQPAVGLEANLPAPGPSATPPEKALAEAGVESFIVVPMTGRLRSIGAITVVRAGSGRRFRTEDAAWLQDLARRAGLEVENARLNDTAQRARVEAFRAADRSRILEDVARALSEALTPREVTGVVVGRATQAMGARGGAVAMLVDDAAAFELVGSGGAAESLSDAYARFPVHARLPLADAARSGEMVVLEDVQAGITRYPFLATTSGALVAVPLVVDGRTTGALGLTFEQMRPFTADELSFLRTLGRQCGDALERARLYGAERSARAVADQEARRAAFLADASRLLTTSFDYASTLASVAQLTVPSFADLCAIHLREGDGKVRTLTTVHRGGAHVPAAEPSIEAGVTSAVENVLRSGEAEIFFDIPEPLLPNFARTEGDLELLRALRIRSLMVLPLLARGRTLGALVLASGGTRHYTPSDLVLAEELARRAALAVDNARLFHEAQDATGRAEETLALLDTVLRSAPIGLGFLDAGFRCVRINDALARFHGLSSGDHAGLPMEEVLQAFPAEVLDEFRRVLLDAVPLVDHEVSAPAPHGGTRHWLVSCYPVRARSGGIFGIGVVVADITARKEAEATLRESEERYRLLVEGVKDHSIILLDPEGRVATWNVGAQQIKGYTAEEILGKFIDVFYTPEDRAAGKPAQDLRAAATEGRFEEDSWHVRKDGQRFFANMVMSPLRDDSGALRGFARITRDLTERTRAREAVERARQQVIASEKLSTMGTLVSGVAHEIRTPLTAIANSVHLLRYRLQRMAERDAAAREKLTSFLQDMDMAVEGVDRINSLVQDLRRFTKVKMGERARMGLETPVAQAVSLFRAANRGHVELQADLRATPPCLVDPLQVQQVALNLLQNAAEAMPHGGVIRVATGETRDGAVLRIQDEGAGMPPEVVARMFEEFFTTKAEGTGLGLSIVRRIVEGHGGKIQCDTAPGKGTTFTVSLPPAL